MTIYERIRALRISKNMSQTDLARKLGYKDGSMITKIESGKVDISQKKVFAFAEALDTTPAYLMGWTVEPSIFDGLDFRPGHFHFETSPHEILTYTEEKLIDLYRGADDRARKDAIRTLEEHQIRKDDPDAR